MFDVGTRVKAADHKTGRVVGRLVEYIGGSPRIFYIVDLENVTGPESERTYLDGELSAIDEPKRPDRS